MKRPIIAGLIAALFMLSTPVMAESIASKVEQLGKMDEVVVSGLRQVTRDGFLRVQFELTNTDNDQQQFTWRIRWMDADGFQVGSDEVWKPELIHGRQKKTLNAVAPAPQATDFKIELYSPENNGRSTDEPPKNQSK